MLDANKMWRRKYAKAHSSDTPEILVIKTSGNDVHLGWETVGSRSPGMTGPSTPMRSSMDMPEDGNCPGTYQWLHFEELGFPLNFRQSVWANVLPVSSCLKIPRKIGFLLMGRSIFNYESLVYHPPWPKCALGDHAGRAGC